MPEKIKFGTDGWRAIIGKGFNLRNVEVVAQAISDYLVHSLKARRLHPLKVAVGYDNRRLSREAARHTAGVLAGNKIKVVLSNQPLPVQAISYTVSSLGCSAGIMITASHNPPRFNGIKIKGAFGGPVESGITRKIERLLFKHKPNKITVHKVRKIRLIKIANLMPAYLNFLRSYIELPLLQKRRLKILVDAMHGTGDSWIAEILKDTPSKVTTIHKDRDFLFGGIKPEPIKACLKEAISLMRQKPFDLGLVTDGDADRIAALDAQGKFINPQQIISLLLLYLIRHRRLKGAVVKTIAGTALLERIAKKYRLKVYETPVGFKYISELMQKKDILIGGEEAGGIGFKNYLRERDGILAGLLLIEMMLLRNRPISALLEDMEKEFGSFVYLRKDLRCPSCEKGKMRVRLARLRKKKTFSGTRIEKVKDYDGLKFCLADGSWILFRLSGTEPVLRVYSEASTLAGTKRLIAEGEKILKA